jgi:ubiquinone/menaquinone biosynthesis C-methylase UbiE
MMIDPKDLMEQLSVKALCQTADDYFKCIQDPTALMGKPFSSLVEAPDILQNMGHILSGLRLGKTMTVLDFAAGTCWFSRLLNQLGCRTISCDASQAALELGKRLFSQYPIIGNLISEPSFIHFDGHEIPLPSESVDRVICHDGFHHVPNQAEVLSELCRVLKSGGVAGFSEPGRFHSQSPQSQYEMKNYKVLENDIVLKDIFAIARKHGFTDLKVKVVSDMEVSLVDYECLTSSKRNASLEDCILKNVRQVMLNKTIFFLYKGAFVPDSRSHIGLSHSIRTSKSLLSVSVGEEMLIPLQVCNTGTARWLHENIGQVGVVSIGTRLYGEEGNLVSVDFSRHALPSAIEPGQVLEQDIRIRFDDVGSFSLSIDLVSEWICWFENVGSTPLSLQVNVC